MLRQMSGHGRTDQLLNGDPDHSPDAGTGLLSAIIIICTVTRNFITSGKSHGHGYWTPVAATRLNIERGCSSDAWF